MNVSNPKNLVGISTPLQVPVSELLLGGYHFVIPSFQRGYRWEAKEEAGDQEARQVVGLVLVILGGYIVITLLQVVFAIIGGILQLILSIFGVWKD